MIREFRQRFWQPPRAHGEIDEERSVGFIELFYDLVYVVVIARIAHHLAEHLTWEGVFDFAVVFGMVWLAWLNGTAYQDLHGREDGRSRTYIFAQMAILSVLGVYAGGAAGEDGQGFALTYVVLLLLLTWMWYAVRRQDTEEWMGITGRYLTGMGISSVVILASAFAPEGARLTIWALFVVGWVAGMIGMEDWRNDELTLRPTDSTIERFGLFTIIVLGEVVVGVVTGLSEAERDFATIATGLIGLCIGFGMWWTYFDFVGRRFPKERRYMRWTTSHLPVMASIAAAGAAMVSLVEHANDLAAPVGASWVLTGSIAVALVGLVLTMLTLRDYDRLPTIYRPTTAMMLAAAAMSLVVGWWAPRPWVLVLVLFAVLSTVWWVAVYGWLSLDDPSDVAPDAGEMELS